MTDQHARPNILIVLADDLGQGDVSTYNPDSAWTTRHLDALADAGMRFDDSHATSSLCTPSRYSLMTGRYNWRSRLKSSVLPGDSMTLIEHDRLTMAAFVKEAGYRTAVVGKWHLGLDWQLRDDGVSPADFGDDAATCTSPPDRYGRGENFNPADWPEVEGIDIDYTKPVIFGPREHGFDYSFITAASLDQPPFVYIENGRALDIPTEIGGDQWELDRRTDAHQALTQKGPMAPGYDITRVAQDFQDKTLEVLDDVLAGDDPWMLYVPSHLVHGPIIPNEPWQGRSGAGPYGDFVLQFDDYVGQLVDRIDAAGKGTDTIIIVTSDNGASGVAGFDALRTHGHDPSNGWRGKKSDIWEGGHREPTIVRWSGRIAAGSVCERMVSHSDVFATVAEVLGMVLPDDAAEDSVSSLPQWLGEDAEGRTDLISHSGGGGFAIRRGQWKLQFTTNGDGMDATADAAQGGAPTAYRPAFLYDLSTDPGERNDLFHERPDVVRELRELLAERIRAGRSTPGPQQSQHMPATWPQIGWMHDPQV